MAASTATLRQRTRLIPYSGETANPYGFKPLVTDDFITDRLKTYYFLPPEREEGPPITDLLKVMRVEELPLSPDYSTLSRALAIDGSLATVGDDLPFELAALKIGTVAQDLNALRVLSGRAGPVPAGIEDRLYRHSSFVTLLPGEGVYGSTPGEDTWQDKFREELAQGYAHGAVPFLREPLSLLQALKNTTPRNLTATCLACKDAYRVKAEENAIDLSDLTPMCPVCFRSFQFTDFLLTESWAKNKKSGDLFLAMMLVMERTVLQGLVQSAIAGSSSLPIDKTIFIVDGPLAIFTGHALNAYFLDRIQSGPVPPLLIGVEKTGTYARLARRSDVMEVLQPGSVAMVTTEASNVVVGRPPEALSHQSFFYGKRFMYRTQDGRKTFVLMVPPATGEPAKLTQGRGLAADEWATYPTLRHLCDFIEENATDQFGPETAALDIVAEANRNASLPSVLSTHFLQKLLDEVSMPPLI